MRLFVTGAAGFIGSNFLYYYLWKYPESEIIGYDKLTYAGNPENFFNLSEDEKSRFTFIKGDICDPEKIADIFKKYSVDCIVNFAAESHVDRSISDPQVFFKSNILGIGILLDAAKKMWLKEGDWRENCKFLQISTDEVYGALGPEGYFTEKSPLDPHSPYSASKAAADLMVKAYHDTYTMPVMITRCSNNYGPYQFPEKLIPLMIRNALKHLPLPLYGDGKQVRDWLYVKDHCRAIDNVVQKGNSGQVYNIGGNNELQNIDLVTLLLTILQEETGDPEINETLIKFVKDRPGHDRRYAIDSSKIQDELGWKPKTNFNEGIRRTIRWYLHNQDWMEHVISGEYMQFYENNYQNRT